MPPSKPKTMACSISAKAKPVAETLDEGSFPGGVSARGGRGALALVAVKRTPEDPPTPPRTAAMLVIPVAFAPAAMTKRNVSPPRTMRWVS